MSFHLNIFISIRNFNVENLNISLWEFIAYSCNLTFKLDFYGLLFGIWSVLYVFQVDWSIL